MNRQPRHPPAFAERLLDRALQSAVYRDEIVGDLHEAYGAVVDRRSPAFARAWYCVQAARLAARYGMRAAFSSETRPNESSSGNRGTQMDRLAMDLRFALRSLAKRRFMTAAVVITLALGLGANAAVFGIIDALVLRPYTLRDVDRIVMPVQTAPNDSNKRESVSAANFLDWRRDTAGGSIRELAAMEWWEANLMGRDEPEHAFGFYVSSSFFAAMGVSPALGRGFLADEEVVGRNRKIVLSDGLWRRRFGADPAVIGQPVLVDGAQSIVVGVMPPGFDFPMGAEVWAPLAFDSKTPPSRTSRYLTVVGRLAPGKTVADAQAEMSVIAARLERDFPKENRQRGIAVHTLANGMRDIGIGAILSLWQAAAIFVLLIACANIANLLLARGTERGREIAVRLALGSSRGRIVRESLLESVLLAVTAIPLSMAVSWGFLALMRPFMPARIVRFVPGWDHMTVNSRQFGVTVLLGVIAALLFGVLPALQMSRGRVLEALKSDGRTGASPGRQRLRRAFVVAEIALVLPLLVAAMLSVRGVTQFLRDWQGYDPNGLLTFRVVLPEARYGDAESRRRFALASVDQFSAIPGVTGVVVANTLPATDSNTSRRIEVEGQVVPDTALPPSVDYRTVNAAYFDVLRMPILSGRAFSSVDQDGSTPVAVVSQSMAAKYWPAGGAIGARVRIGKEPWMIVVGICGDVIHDIDRRNLPTLYRPVTQALSDYLIFALRTPGDPLAIVVEVRQALSRVDPTQPVFEIRSMRQVLHERTIGLQYVAGVMGTFAGLALILALLGLYAVMTFLVAQRVHEIGVRIALGATAADVTRLTLGDAARLTTIGVAIGLVLAVALGRAMEAGLLGLVASDVKVSAGLALILGVTAIGASYLPARRAARVDPIVALRNE